MTAAAERFRRIHELFRAALRLRPEERDDYLQEQCADDDSLKIEVIALLDEDAGSGGALDRPALCGSFDLDALADSSQRAVEAPLPVSIGRYRILGVLGEGGMGIVYKAEQDHPRRTVALKVVRRDVVSRQLLQRFRHEAEVLGQLRHPGIAQIFEAGTADAGQGGQPFFAMELVAGQPLLEYANAHHLDPKARLALMAGICDALHHAHQRGVIHRDLKPGNILVDESGQSKVLDFGVARATDSDVQTVTLQTDVGQLVGTVPYMSPEQAAGDPTGIDIRSDVYSLGVILYELLTGRLPYELKQKMLHEAVRVIREDEPSRLSSIDRIYRGDLETILSKALEKTKDRRYQSASDLAADIRRYLGDEPIAARPATTLYQLRKFTQRNRRLVIAVSAGAGIAFVAMLIATVVSLRQSRLATEAQRVAESRTIQAERQSYRAAIAAAAASVAKHDAMSARRFLDSAPQSLRNWEWRYVGAQLDDSVVLLNDDEGIAAYVTGDDPNQMTTITRGGRIDVWDLRHRRPKTIGRINVGKVLGGAGAPAAGRLVARTFDEATEDRRIVIVDAVSGELVAQAPSGAISFLATNADASCVAGLNRGIVTLWHPPSGEGMITLPCDKPHAAVAVSDDCQTVLVAQDVVRVFDSAGTMKERLGGMAQLVTAMAVTSDGSRILTGDYFGTVKIFQEGVVNPLRTVHAHAGSVATAVFLEDGQTIATGGSASDPTVRLWNAEGAVPLRVFVGCAGGVLQLGAAGAGGAGHDDSSLVALDAAGDLRMWSLRSPDPTTVLQGHESFVYDALFTPDGSRLVTGSWDKTIRIFDARTGERLGVLRGEHGYVTGLDISPDGAFIATGHHRGLWSESEVRLWDARTGALVRDLPKSYSEVTSVKFSPDGTRLALTARMSGTRVWDVTSPGESPQLTHPRREPWEVDWSPDGSALAVCYADGTVMVIDSTTGRELRQWKAHEKSANFVGYSPDGSQIVTASADTLVKLWDAATGELLRTFEGHRDVLWCAAYSPDGTRLATGSNDNTIRLWDVESGEQLLELRGHDDYIHSLDFSPDGSMLGSASGDGTVRIWDCRPLHERWRGRGEETADERR